MNYDEPIGNWVKLPVAWSELRPGLREEVACRAGDIHTFDGGHLHRVDGQWEVLSSGTSNDADVVRNALQKPN
ncbi:MULTISPECIES: hypothetical protein [Mesorhizobium]|uniref:Uncharacterized protein n=2 Tax=Mesorhizobium TaxID=68287 RepID=A0A1A5J4Z9_RHILI|nr:MULTISPECIES: hypothetical protein [Mesorhizobium]ETA72355.1 hypothetical protein MesloDRAFT_1225 [Mesorhizobium japonicum R7A]MBE1709686.1 hypothetical protein [Mesorhizobium japonicum]MBE1714355.1 hypothetical protein [Mesorhizobium japonicum]MUT25335.1 hypothetical protein [Mesorhizobium japonicum]MUT28611.1 hypothetical protein [Mesorhizobium japonicum]